MRSVVARLSRRGGVGRVRWRAPLRIVVPLVLVLIAAAVVSTRGAEYEAEATLLVVPEVLQVSDPLARVDPIAVVEIVRHESTAQALRRGGAPGRYEVRGQSGDPFVEVEAWAARPEDATQTVRAVQGAIVDVVSERERGVDAPVLAEPLAAPAPARAVDAGDGSGVRYVSSGGVLLRAPGQFVGRVGDDVHTLRLLEVGIELPLAAEGMTPGESYLLDYDSREPAPVISARVMGADPVQTMRDLDILVDTMAQQLDVLQGPGGSLVLRPLTLPDSPVRAGDALAQSVLVVGLIGVGIAWVGVSELERHTAGRRSTGSASGSRQGALR